METLSSTSTTLQSAPSISSTSTHKCAHCSNPSKYTCPRCTTHTCSLPCTRTHKSSTQCTGIRAKAAYVPMNKYGWGSMMSDYCFLEDVGRKVGEVGKEIVRSGFDMNARSSSEGMRRGGRTRGRGGRGGRGGGRGRGGGKGKREVLKVFLEARDIELELLPNGMERRRLNQSVWDQKYVCSLCLEILQKLNIVQESNSTLNCSVQILPVGRSAVYIERCSQSLHTSNAPQRHLDTSPRPRTKTHTRTNEQEIKC